jgi:Arc/MetJ family transcription regulator
MTANVDVDSQLLAEAKRCCSAPTNGAAVEEALRLLIQTRRQTGLRKLIGEVRWTEELDSLRTDRSVE